MVINSFLIEGISNIGSLRLDLGQLNALIAPNGYGKSNVLSAVEFGMKFLSATPQEKLQMMRSRFMPINNDMLGKDFCFEISGQFDGDEQDVQFQYGYRFKWASGDNDGIILSEWLKVKKSADQRYRQMLSRTSADGCLIVPSATRTR